MKAAIAISLFVLIVVGYTAVSTSDYYEAVQSKDLCRDMVQAGAWPQEVCNER